MLSLSKHSWIQYDTHFDKRSTEFTPKSQCDPLLRLYGQALIKHPNDK